MGLKIKLRYLATGYKGSVSDYKSKAGQITGNPVYKPPSMLVNRSQRISVFDSLTGRVQHISRAETKRSNAFSTLQ